MGLIEDLGMNSTLLASGVGLALIVILIIIKVRRPRGADRKQPKLDADEKVALSSKIEELLNVNKELRERLRGLEMEYLERQDRIKKDEDEAKQKTKELDEGLKEVYALKELIEDYRVKVGRLTKDNQALEAKVGELTAKLKDGKKQFEEERAAEIEKLESEKEEVKKKAKEMVLDYKKETEEKISALEKENKELKERIAKLKEQYSAWEAIEGL